MEEKKELLYKDEFGNYVIYGFEDLGFELEFDEINRLTKFLNKIGKERDNLKQENEKLKEDKKMWRESYFASTTAELKYKEKLDEIKKIMEIGICNSSMRTIGTFQQVLDILGNKE
jgi:hypothetical protein